jgi:hypothetical protein
MKELWCILCMGPDSSHWSDAKPYGPFESEKLAILWGFKHLRSISPHNWYVYKIRVPTKEELDCVELM